MMRGWMVVIAAVVMWGCAGPSAERRVEFAWVEAPEAGSVRLAFGEESGALSVMGAPAEGSGVWGVWLEGEPAHLLAVVSKEGSSHRLLSHVGAARRGSGRVVMEPLETLPEGASGLSLARITGVEGEQVSYEAVTPMLTGWYASEGGVWVWVDGSGVGRAWGAVREGAVMVAWPVLGLSPLAEVEVGLMQDSLVAPLESALTAYGLEGVSWRRIEAEPLDERVDVSRVLSSTGVDVIASVEGEQLVLRARPGALSLRLVDGGEGARWSLLSGRLEGPLERAEELLGGVLAMGRPHEPLAWAVLEGLGDALSFEGSPISAALRLSELLAASGRPDLCLLSLGEQKKSAEADRQRYRARCHHLGLPPGASRGEVERVERAYARAVAGYQALDFVIGEADTYAQWAELHEGLGREEQARVMRERAAWLFASAGQHVRAGRMFVELARAESWGREDASWAQRVELYVREAKASSSAAQDVAVGAEAQAMDALFVEAPEASESRALKKAEAWVEEHKLVVAWSWVALAKARWALARGEVERAREAWFAAAGGDDRIARLHAWRAFTNWAVEEADASALAEAIVGMALELARGGHRQGDRRALREVQRAGCVAYARRVSSGAVGVPASGVGVVEACGMALRSSWASGGAVRVEGEALAERLVELAGVYRKAGAVDEAEAMLQGLEVALVKMPLVDGERDGERARLLMGVRREQIELAVGEARYATAAAALREVIAVAEREIEEGRLEAAVILGLWEELGWWHYRSRSAQRAQRSYARLVEAGEAQGRPDAVRRGWGGQALAYAYAGEVEAAVEARERVVSRIQGVGGLPWQRWVALARAVME